MWLYSNVLYTIVKSCIRITAFQADCYKDAKHCLPLNSSWSLSVTNLTSTIYQVRKYLKNISMDEKSHLGDAVQPFPNHLDIKDLVYTYIVWIVRLLVSSASKQFIRFSTNSRLDETISKAQAGLFLELNRQKCPSFLISSYSWLFQSIFRLIIFGLTTI